MNLQLDKLFLDLFEDLWYLYLKKTKQTITLWEIGHKNIGLRYAESAVSYSQVRYLPVTKDVSHELYILISREESGLNHMNTTRAIHVTST